MPKGQYDYKIRKLELQAQKKAQDTALLRQIVASPLVQIVGTVAVTETLESMGVLSGRWAGAVEGGIITMVGLQALKDYGVIGAGMVGAGLGLGALTEGKLDKVAEMGLNALAPGLGGIAQLVGVI